MFSRLAISLALAVLAAAGWSTGAHAQALEVSEVSGVSEVSEASEPANNGRRGLGIHLTDGDSKLVIHPVALLDYQVFIDSGQPGPNNRFQIPLAALVVNGTAKDTVGVKLFAGYVRGNPVLLDAWVQVEVAPQLTVRAGKQRVPLTDERLSNPPFLPLIGPATASTLLPNRDLGVRAFGKLARGRVSYDVGVFAGNPANTIAEAETNDSKDILGRVLVSPFAEMGWPMLTKLRLGIAASYGGRDGTLENPELPLFRSFSGTPFFTYSDMAVASGPVTRLVPQVRWEAGRFGLYGDYAHVWEEVSEREVVTRAWHAVGRVILTDERAPFFSPSVTRPRCRSRRQGSHRAQRQYWSARAR